MNPLIRVQPTKDGGRRMLTEEAKATFVAWLRMMQDRLIAQRDGIERKGGKPIYRGDGVKLTKLLAKINLLWDLIQSVDLAFDRDAFDTAFKWATEVMHGQPDNPAGGRPPSDEIGSGESEA